MWHRTCFVTIAIAPAGALAVGAPTADKPALQGEWQAVGVDFSGKQAGKDDAQVKAMRFVIKGDELAVTGPGGGVRKKTMRLDATKTPRALDLTSHDGNEAGQTAACIYKVEKDRLTLCIPYAPTAAGVRPKAFQAGADDGLMVISLERVKP